MANVVVFLDSAHANIFEIGAGKDDGPVARREIRKHVGADNSPQQSDEPKFYKDLCADLKSADRILLVGPGQAKTEFKHFLEKLSDKHTNDKVVGVETVDHPSDGQMVALGRKFVDAHPH
jgi:stalled ribosome rescue protein Dom34